MIQWRVLWLCLALLVLGLFFLPTGRAALAQGGPPPRPTLDPTQRPLTVEPIETIRVTLTSTVRQATATPRATQTQQATATTRSLTPTVSRTVAPSRTATQAAATASPTRPLPATPTLSRPTLTPAPTPNTMPRTGQAPPSLTMLLMLSAGLAALCFVAGVYVGLTSTRGRH